MASKEDLNQLKVDSLFVVKECGCIVVLSGGVDCVKNPLKKRGTGELIPRLVIAYICEVKTVFVNILLMTTHDE